MDRIIEERNIPEQQIERDTSHLYSIPDTWTWALSSIVCEKIQDGSHFSPKIQYEETGPARYLYVTAKNIKPEGIDLSEVTYVDEVFHRSIFDRCNPEKGDVLLIKDGVKTGIAAINDLEEEFSLLSSVALFKTGQILDSHFLRYFLNSPMGFKMITGEMTGTAIRRIILKKLRSFFIPLPLPSEQKRIRNILDYRFSLLKKTETEVLKTIEQTKDLRQSVLKIAFEGRLVAQDPANEPAEKLLERIRVEKEKRMYGKKGSNITRDKQFGLNRYVN